MNLSLVTITSAFITGISIGIVYNHASVVILFLFGISFFSFVLYAISKIKKYKSIYSLLIAVLCALCALGTLRGEFYVEPTLRLKLSTGIQTFTTEITSVPEVKESSQTILVRTPNEATSIQVITPLYPVFKVGEKLTIIGIIKEPTVLLPEEVDISTSVQSFDYSRYLHTKNIVGVMVYPRIIVSTSSRESFIYSLYEIKQRSVEILNEKIPSPENALASGVLLGTDTLPKENKDAVRVASLSHIIVLSGFNIAIIVTLVIFLLRFLPLYLRIGISLFVVTMFVVMVGGGASLIRATLMAYVALLAMAIGRKYSALTALFFALLVYVSIAPEALLYDVGLILSFLATLGIILFYELIESGLKKYISYEGVRGILGATISVMITTTPYLMYTFGTFSVYGLIANILALPLVPALMASTFMLLCTSMIPVISHIFSFISYILASLILCISDTIASLPYASLSISISFTTMCVLYILVCAIYWYVLYLKNKISLRVSDTDESIVNF